LQASSPAVHDRQRTLPPVTVDHVVIGRNTVAFHVSRIGVPVEVRASYFPWWSAQGAEGVWRLAPDNLVVVPTSHEVVLTASPKLVDRLAQLVSIAALIATAGLALWDRTRRQRLGACAG
jgi:hypothetical protein